jgi:N-acetylmuramoyl-L-alanine amidase
LKRTLQVSGKNNIYPFGCQDNLMKLPVLSTYLAGFRFLAYLSVVLLIALTLATRSDAGQDGNPQARARKVLVLDPGHGGHDKGAGNANAAYEKEVTLMFARLLAEKLKPAYTVHLTRADDYEVDLMHRTAVANHLKADLFLSIHTGASTLHNPSGMLIAYYDSRFRLQDTGSKNTHDTPEKGNQLTPWDTKPSDHMEKSRYLAELLKEKILAYDQEIKLDIQGMPLVVLEGADQPALLIEIGYLTNPTDLRKLKNNAVLTDYTQIISGAVDAYFSEKITAR